MVKDRVQFAPIDIETEILEDGYDYIISADEVGRGAWFGECYVGGSCLPFTYIRHGVKFPFTGFDLSGISVDEACRHIQKHYLDIIDSKDSRFSDTKAGTAHEKRMIAVNNARRTWLAGFSASASSKAVDRMGINDTISELASRVVQKVVNRLTDHVIPDVGFPPIKDDWRNVYVLVDAGITVPILKDKNAGFREVVKGDQKSLSIALASLIAKTDRDIRMVHWHNEYPQYGFDSHKGYHTAKHVECVREHGLLTGHRTSFANTQKMIDEGIEINNNRK